jgi:bacterioferritin-associated ferredoxin
MTVTKCVCYNKTFAEMKARMDEKNLTTFDDLKNELCFGENCKICVPYVRKMIQTGETAFALLPKDEWQSLAY